MKTVTTAVQLDVPEYVAVSAFLAAYLEVLDESPPPISKKTIVALTSGLKKLAVAFPRPDEVLREEGHDLTNCRARE